MPATSLPNDKLAYRIPELVEVSGVSRSAIFIDLASGELKSFMRGKRRLVLRTEALAWLQRLAKAGSKHRAKKSKPADTKAA